MRIRDRRGFQPRKGRATRYDNTTDENDPQGRYGNVSCTSASNAPCTQLTFNLQNNQITSIGGQTPTYDAAGEMLSDGTGTGTAAYTWNAMGRIATVTPYNSSATGYVYDGDGQRVEDTASQSLYWYGPDGKLVGETDGGDVNIQWIYFDGRKISKFNMSPEGPWGAEFYDNADGSLLLETDGYGNPNCRANYYPFGEPVGPDCQIYESFQYAGLYADKSGELGDDSAAYRQYSDIYYRWFSPDPGGRKVVKIDNPQTWNMYAYVGDNPTTLNDPSGMAANGCGKESPQVCDEEPTQNGSTIESNGNVICNEVGGVRPTTKKNGAGSTGNLQAGRVAIGHVLINRESAHQRGGVASSSVPPKDRNNSEYRDSQRAAREAARTLDSTHGATHFYLRYPGERTPSWASGRKPVATYGPFENAAGGGDVPRNENLWIVIIP